MGEWSDMEYEYGYVDNNGNIADWIDSTNESNQSITKTIIVNLTPTKYLNEQQRYMRIKLFNEQLTSYKLEVMHDKLNNYDKYAIEIYCNEVSIGYVSKYDSDEDINNFCFSGSSLCDLDVSFNGDEIILSRVFSKYEIDKIESLKNENERIRREEEEREAEQKRKEYIESQKKDLIKKYHEDLTNLEKAYNGEGFIGVLKSLSALGGEDEEQKMYRLLYEYQRDEIIKKMSDIRDQDYGKNDYFYEEHPDYEWWQYS